MRFLSMLPIILELKCWTKINWLNSHCLNGIFWRLFPFDESYYIMVPDGANAEVLERHHHAENGHE